MTGFRFRDRLDGIRRRAQPVGGASACSSFKSGHEGASGSDDGGVAAPAAVYYSGDARGPGRHRVRRALQLGIFPTGQGQVRVNFSLSAEALGCSL